VVITNDAGAVTSSPALMQWTNGVLPTITMPPVSVTCLTNAPGITVMFSCTAVGYTSLQWYQTNGSTAPSTALTLTTSSAVAQTNGFFMVAANASGSVTSLTALFATTNSLNLPVITLNPVSLVNITNTTFTLTAAASGPGVVTFQWYNTNNWIPATSISQSLVTNVAVVGTNWYALVANNGSGSVTSSAAYIGATNGLPYVPPPQFLFRARVR
jgi:hypothetical protein